MATKDLQDGKFSDELREENRELKDNFHTANSDFNKAVSKVASIRSSMETTSDKAGRDLLVSDLTEAIAQRDKLFQDKELLRADVSKSDKQFAGISL